MNEQELQKIIDILAQKIGVLEVNNVILKVENERLRMEVLQHGTTESNSQ